MNHKKLLKRKKKWIKRLENEGKLQNPKEDHSHGLRALQNRTKRKLLRFIGDDMMMIKKNNNMWRLTPRSIGYLKKAELRKY